MAEAQVLITPDTTKFRTLLAAELATAVRGLPPQTVPVVPVVTGQGFQALTTQAAGASAAVRDVASAQTAGIQAARKAASATAAHTVSMGKLEQGALASTLSLAGVRGATLAASSSFLAGAAAITLFAKSVSSAAALEAELNVFRVTTKATADEMERVSAVARELGRDITLPGVSSRDAAEAMTSLARAGLEVEDALDGAKGVLQLATAAQISNAEATELAASALNAFQLSGNEAVHVADILATSANEAQGSITDMGIALRQSSAIADLVGLSLEDTAGFLTILARAGLRGSDAGTSFRVALQRLIAPTKDASAALDTLNVRLRDSEDRLRPEVFFELGEALSQLSVKQRQATLVTIFGADASRAAALLGREQLSTLRELQTAYEEQGTAAELAAARNVGLTGQVSALTSNLETLGTSLGAVVLPALTGLVQGLNELITGAGEVITVVSDVGRAVDDFGQSILGIPSSGDFMGDVAKQAVRSTIPIQGLTSAVRGLQRTFGDSAADIQGSAQSVTRDVQNLFRTFQDAGGGPTALNQMVLALDEMADKLAKGDAEAIRLGRELREIIREVQQVGFLPPTVIDIQARLDESQVTTETDKASARIIENLERLGGPMAELGIDLITSLGDGMKSAAPIVAAETGQILVQSLGTQLAVAEATGAGDAELLRILRDREAKQAAFLEKILARPQDAKTQALVRDAARNLEQTRTQIQSILDKQAADAKAASADVVRAQSDANQSFLDSIGGREGRLQNQALIAAATAGFRDDIRANTALRNFYKNAIAEAKKTISDARLRATTVASLIADQIRASIAVRTAERALADALREEREDREAARQEQREERTQGLQLNLELAQINENVAAQRRALNALIADINKQIADTKKGTNKWRELRNARARYRKELEELAADEKEAQTGDNFSSLAFDFLQKQQGFAANLLGNLIPSSATAGLVGGRSDPGTQLQAQAAAKTGTPTYGQMATEVDILKQVLQVLREIQRGRAHPEAALQRAQVNSTMDFQGGV